MAKKINITAQLNAATTDGILADAGQIFDAKKGKFQEQVNEEFEGALEEAITSEDTDMVVESIEEGIVHNALRKTKQILTEAEKEQARENIGAVSEQTFENEAVRVKKQVFTSEQKYQARHNISAITAEEAEKIAQDKINETAVSAPDKLQAVKELSSWLESNPDSAATMNAAIQDNASDIQRLYRGTGIDEYSQFSTGMDYAAGAVVLYDGVLFRFKADHAAGEWDQNEVEEWSEKKEREELVSEVGKYVAKGVVSETGTTIINLPVLKPGEYDVKKNQSDVTGLRFFNGANAVSEYQPFIEDKALITITSNANAVRLYGSAAIETVELEIICQQSLNGQLIKATKDIESLDKRKVEKSESKDLIDSNYSSLISSEENEAFTEIVLGRSNELIKATRANGDEEVYNNVNYNGILSVNGLIIKSVGSTIPSITTPRFEDRLSIVSLLNKPKRRCLFHDNFSRHTASEGLVEFDTLDYSESFIEDNGVERDIQIAKYKYLSVGQGGNLKVVVNDNTLPEYNKRHWYATNNVREDDYLEIVYKEFESNDYRVRVQRHILPQSEANIAFNIKDIDNFMYVRFNYGSISIHKKMDGVESVLYSRSGYERIDYVDVFVDVNYTYVYADGIFVYCLWSDYAPKCGLLFRNSVKSSIDNIVIDCQDYFKEYGIDNLIETGKISNAGLGGGFHLNNEGGEYIISPKNNNSKHSLCTKIVFEEGVAKKRVEVRPLADDISSLRSYVMSFDVYFDSEEFQNDSQYEEIFVQNHTRIEIQGQGLNPNFAIYVNNGKLYAAVRSYKNRKVPKEFFGDNEDVDVNQNKFINKSFVLGHISNEDIKPDVWHNFTIFIKEGYEEIHEPRTVVYIDGKKVCDSSSCNVYNDIYGNYLKFGIYKWDWAKQIEKPEVTSRTLFFDNIKYYS